jgi:hypothetical protein
MSRVNRLKISLLTTFFFLLFCVGCNNLTTNTVIMYKTYKMNQDDVRLKLLNHPLYSFEYPDTYDLIDLNLPPPTDMGGPPMIYGLSELSFNLETDYEKSQVGIGVEKRNIQFSDSHDKFTNVVSTANAIGNNITISKIAVSGITAEYIEYYCPRVAFLQGADIKDTHSSVRMIVFDYQNLIWTIGMIWTYAGQEPANAQLFFHHIIETFKILR